MKVSLLIGLAAALMGARSTPPRKEIPAIAKAANGAIVSIIMSDKDGSPIAQGSGFLISNDGVILTNYHVIAEGSSAIVKFPNGAFYVVDGVLAFDKARDVAVIKVHGENFRTLTLGNSDQLQVGEEVVAIGNPLSLESTVSNGIVSGIRTVEEKGGKFLQVTTPISPGSSGGPLFNMAGEVVGITTLYLEGGENLNFAIPINDAKRVLPAESTQIQALPNEPEPEQAETHAGDAPSPQVSPTAARAYYKQLYDAGRFPDAPLEFVCFDDNPARQWFFTFGIRGYNERYAKAASAHVQNLLKKQDDTEAWQTMRSIEASEPNVSFVDEDELPFEDVVFGKGTEAYLRSGGLLLASTVYYKGVKEADENYHAGGGDSWVDQNQPTNAPTKQEKTVLSLDPLTGRFVKRMVMTFANSETSVSEVGSGTCQKIPAKRSN